MAEPEATAPQSLSPRVGRAGPPSGAADRQGARVAARRFAPRPLARFGHGRTLRLRRSEDFRRVQGKGRRLRAGHLLALWLPGTGETSRVGLTVSKKVGNSVVRNRVKRWLREGVRHERHRLTGRVDVVLIAHPEAATAGLRALVSDVIAIFDAAAQQSGGRRRR